MRSMYEYVRKTNESHDFPERQWCQCREGLHALPKTMFDIFLKAVGSFFEEGHKALPCTGDASP